MFHGLGPVTCSESELTSGTVNPFSYFGRTPQTGISPSQVLCLHGTARHTHTHIHKADIRVHPWLERDLNPRSQLSNVQNRTLLRQFCYYNLREL